MNEEQNPTSGPKQSKRLADLIKWLSQVNEKKDFERSARIIVELINLEFQILDQIYNKLNFEIHDLGERQMAQKLLEDEEELTEEKLLTWYEGISAKVADYEFKNDSDREGPFAMRFR